MSKEKEIIIETDLSSGHFENQIPFYSQKQISHYTDKEYINFFIRVLIEQSSGKLELTQASKHFSENQTKRNKLILNNDDLVFENSDNINDGDTFYFEHLNRVFCFFPDLSKRNTVEIPVLYELTRRFWKRYKSSEKLHIELISNEKDPIKGIITDYDINGLGLALDQDLPELFDTYTIKIPFEDKVYQFEGQIVHHTQIGHKAIAGFYFAQRHNKEYLEDIFWKLYKQDNQNIEELSQESNLEAVKEKFENAPIPQPFSPKYLENTPKAKTIMLKDGKGYSSGISLCKYNQGLTIMHTLVLQAEHLSKLPVDLYEYVATKLLISENSKYFGGYWPSKNKYIDRGYTNFVKSDYDDVHHFYQQINIYKCQVKTGNIKRKINNSNENLIGLRKKIREKLGDIFCDALRVDDDLEDLKIISTKKGDAIQGIGLCIPQKRDLEVFGLSNQLWIIQADNIDIVNDLKDKANDCFREKDQETFNIHTFKDYEGLLKQPEILSSLNDVNVWIAGNTRAKAYINYLKRINFELSLLSSKKTITKKYVKFIKGFTSSFYKRKSLRYHSKDLQNDISVKFDMSSMSIDSVKVNDIDTFGMSAEIPANITIKKDSDINVIFSFQGREPQILKGVVKYCRPKVVSGFKDLGNHVGIEFDQLDLDSKRTIREYCFRKLNPDLSMFSKEDFRSLVNLLEKSKYFEYYDSTKQRQFEKESEPIYTSLELLIPDLARVTVFKNDENNSIIGTHAFYRRANRTWQLHQLAVDETLTIYKSKFPTKVVLNGAFQYLCLDPDVDYVITYFHNDAAIAKTYFDVKNHHDNPKEYAYIEFTGFLYEDLDKKSFEFKEDYILSIASEEEKIYLQEEIKHLVKEIEYEALEYGNLSQRDLIKKWSKTGAIRDREVLLIKDKKGVILHFAVCDVSPLGINFIGLVDIFRIFNLNDNSTSNSQSMQILANYVAQFYKNKGRSQVYLEVDPSIGQYFNGLNVRQLGKNWRLIASRNTFMTALQYFNSRFERLQQRLKQVETQ